MRERVPRCRLGFACNAAAAAVIVGFVGCAGATHERVVVRVGQAKLTPATIDHWTSVMAGGRLPKDPARLIDLRTQALSFLISSEWLLGEAAKDGIRLSPEEVSSQRVQKERSSFPGGAPEQSAFLRATGQRASDLAFEAKAELAARRIRQLLASREPPISRAQVVRYYRRNKERFVIPERVELAITNRKSVAEAEALRRSASARRNFAKIARRESLELSPISYSTRRGTDATLARAIHFARPHVLTGPVLAHRVDYYMFEVFRATPARLRPLGQVEAAIRRQLAAKQRQRTLAAFIKAWRTRWTARSSCTHGYVVQKCRQYAGPKLAENSATFD
jgi:hypothetical protein